MNESAFVLIGVGGAGGKIVNAVAEANASGMRAVALDTDFDAVARLGNCQQIRIGASRFGGLGSGGDRNGAAMAFDETRAAESLFAGAQIAVIVAGISRGTGAGVLPRVLEHAARRNVRTLVFMITPFPFEGVELERRAAETGQALTGLGDLRILCRNEDLCPTATGETVADAFNAATRTLADGMTLLWRMTTLPGYLNLDFATLAGIIECGRGMGHLGVGVGSGPQRVRQATEALLGTTGMGLGNKLNGAKAALAGIVGSEDLRLSEVSDIMTRVGAALSMEAPIRMGTVLDPSVGPTLHVIVLLFREWAPLYTPEAGSENGTETTDPDTPSAQPTGRARSTRYSAPAPAPSATPHDRSRRILYNDRFQNAAATWVNGENLDRPTFLRRKLHLDLS